MSVRGFSSVGHPSCGVHTKTNLKSPPPQPHSQQERVSTLARRVAFESNSSQDSSDRVTPPPKDPFGAFIQFYEALHGVPPSDEVIRTFVRPPNYVRQTSPSDTKNHFRVSTLEIKQHLADAFQLKKYREISPDNNAQ